MWRWLKRALMELTAGAAVGFVVWCLLGKQLTGMLFGSLGGSFSCRADVEIALDKFVAMQLYSAIAGALVAFLGMLILRRWWTKSRAQTAVAGAGTPPGVPR
jgi:hypothetical protein